jgi:hypothetical protein
MSTIYWSENLKGRELGRPGRRWEDNIRIDLRERCGLDELAQDRDQR